MNLQKIANYLEAWAPKELAADWDNIGLQIGAPKKEIKKILIALDVDTQCLEKITSQNYDLVITHHPLFFTPLKSINYQTDIGRIIKTFIETDTALYSAHTNLDKAQDGVNDQLIKDYDLDPKTGSDFEDGFGKIITLQTPTPLSEFLAPFPAKLTGNKDKDTISKVAFLAGSGKSQIRHLPSQNIDLFITGEAGYHDEIFCELNGISLLLLGHRESEIGILPIIESKLNEAFPELIITLTR